MAQGAWQIRITILVHTRKLMAFKSYTASSKLAEVWAMHMKCTMHTHMSHGHASHAVYASLHLAMQHILNMQQHASPHVALGACVGPAKTPVAIIPCSVLPPSRRSVACLCVVSGHVRHTKAIPFGIARRVRERDLPRGTRW